MKDIQATLRRIDEEITGHNQLIARSRVEIMRLQDTRATLMGLAEEDAIAAHMSREERQAAINGEHARPMLVVRKIGSGGEAMASSEGLNKAGNKRGMNNPPTRHKRGGGTAMGKMRQRIADVLKDGSELTGTEIANYLGVPADEVARKPLQNALYNMRVTGQLHRDDDKRYSLPRLSRPEGRTQ